MHPFRSNSLLNLKLLAHHLAGLAMFMMTGLATGDEINTEQKDNDRKAILAMQGEYEVGFKFLETVVLKPNYHRKGEKISGAFEKVYLVEDSPNKIVLQHLLVSDNGEVTKHWRQDWIYEASTRLEFTEDQIWRVKKIADDKIKGYWTQCVYEVTDAPRYCGTGKWNHHYGHPTWTSDRTWRPLPRREYTTRNDYNALNVENRHTITPAGWTHEQDNTKVVRKGEHTELLVVREVGFNDYQKVSVINFKAADDYWQKTAAYWAGIRQRWETMVQKHDCLQLKSDLNDTQLMNTVFEQAEHVTQGYQADQQVLDKAFTTWVAACPVR